MSVQKSISTIQESLDGTIHMVNGLSEAVIRFKPSEEAWSVHEIVCHVDEAIPYWLDEIDRLRNSPGTEWGRGLQDEARLTAVAQAGQRSTQEVLAQLESLKATIANRLGSLTEEQLKMEAPSRNPRFGTKPIQFIVDHLIDEHAAKHLGQIQRNIQQYEEAR